MKVQKSDLKKASITFKDEILLNENRLNNLMDLAKSNNFAQKKELRPLAWRVFLGTIPQDKSLEEWIDEIDRQRNEYKEKLEKYCSIKKLKNKDPLLINENNENDDILISQDKDMIDKSIINLINLDLTRTHQAIELFQKTKTKNILANILFIYSKENEDLPYGQGMNELISMLYICFYPYYFAPKEKNIEKDEIKKYLNDLESHYEDIYLYFHNENEIQSDLFFLFESLMHKGIKDLYGKDDIQKDDINYTLYELFPDIIKDHTNEERPTHLNLRSYSLIKEKLKIVDRKLYNHFKKININCNYFLHRWFKCIFTREFNINEVSSLWDKIFYYEYMNNTKYKYPLVYIDFIALTMIMRIRYQLIKKDEGDCFTILFHYPKGDDISDIFEISEKIGKIFEKKLKNEEFSDINDEIFEIIKANTKLNDEENLNSESGGEANEELIISPHMYNQKNNKGLITCDKKNENVVFCGKYFIKKKYMYGIGLSFILFCVFILIYNNIKEDGK